MALSGWKLEALISRAFRLISFVLDPLITVTVWYCSVCRLVQPLTTVIVFEIKVLKNYWTLEAFCDGLQHVNGNEAPYRVWVPIGIVMVALISTDISS